MLFFNYNSKSIRYKIIKILMYVGSLSDFFYKPKDYLESLPKYKQRQEITYLNINNRIFRINNITGNITLINNLKEHNLTVNEKRLLKKNNLNRFPYNKSRNNDNILFSLNNTSKTKETRIQDFANKTLNGTNIKKNRLMRNYIMRRKKISYLQLDEAYKTSYNLNSPKIKSIQSVEETFKKNVMPYYNKSPKRYIKPKIAFGQKILYDTIKNKKDHKKNISNEKNIFLTIYKQHFNNITNDGNNDKIYFETKNDNIIMKKFKEQILREKIEKELKNKFKFYIGVKNNILKVPNLSPKNFEFYNGYSVSDNKRGNNSYHKLFFRYVNKHRLEENREKNNTNIL